MLRFLLVLHYHKPHNLNQLQTGSTTACPIQTTHVYNVHRRDFTSIMVSIHAWESREILLLTVHMQTIAGRYHGRSVLMKNYLVELSWHFKYMF